jgi:hypothetical protein
MRNQWMITAFLIGCCASLAAQTADAPPASQDAAAGIGYSYQLPPDWTVIEPKPSPQPPAPTASLAPKKGTACISVSRTAKHGDPASVIVVVELPFDCYGQIMTGQDLAGFGSGIADGLKQAFDIASPVLGTYTLGSHSLWIERARGNSKDQTQAQNGVQYTVEVACTVLKKAAVCWMTTAADEASLHAFEQMPVTLDQEAAAPLVPAAAFDKAPAAP